MNGSILRSSFEERYFSASKPATAPWNRTGNALTSNRVIGTMPLLPSSTLLHAVSTALPTGETMPRPVMTTRRLDKRLPRGDGLMMDEAADWRLAAFPGRRQMGRWKARDRRFLRPGCGAQ